LGCEAGWPVTGNPVWERHPRRERDETTTTHRPTNPGCVLLCAALHLYWLWFAAGLQASNASHVRIRGALISCRRNSSDGIMVFLYFLHGRIAKTPLRRRARSRTPLQNTLAPKHHSRRKAVLQNTKSPTGLFFPYGFAPASQTGPESIVACSESLQSSQVPEPLLKISKNVNNHQK
jgi:hypothetical protein